MNRYDLFRTLHRTSLPDAEIDAIEEAAQVARVTRLDSAAWSGAATAYAVWHKGRIIGYVGAWNVTREGRGRWANATVEAREFTALGANQPRAKRKDAVIDVLVRYAAGTA